MEQTKKNRGEFLYNVGNIINEKVILKRYKYNNTLYYDYQCLIDDNIDKMTEYNLKNGMSCNVCVNQKILKGVNDISTTDPNSIKLFKNIEDCYTHCRGSTDKVLMVCPNCGNEKLRQIDLYFRYKSLACICDDRISYGEKMIFSILTQLNINFEYHKRDFDWLKPFKKEYDFYIPSLNCVIEAHGKQHYEESARGRSLKEEVENDKFKDELAKDNGVQNYIIIDCRQSDLDFIKNSILNHKQFNSLIDTSNVDWEECYIFSLSTRVKEACDSWNNGVHSSVKIAMMMKLSKSTIQKYLNRGVELNWCDYNAKNVQKMNGNINILKATDKIKKKVLCLNNNQIFESASDASRKSLEIFGINISRKYISYICNGKKDNYKGFKFKFI